LRKSGNSLLYFLWDVITNTAIRRVHNACTHLFKLYPWKKPVLYHCSSCRHTTNQELTAHRC
jgi:hypothetical protein